MPIPLKDFLRKRFKDANILSSDVEAVLSSSGLVDLQFPDDAVEKFDENYMTRKRAENDSAINAKLQYEILNNVDRVIEPLLKLLPEDKAKELGKDKLPKTYERIEKLNEALADVVKNATVKNSTDVQKVENEWSDKYKNLENLTKSEKAELVRKHQDDNLNLALIAKLSGYKFADAYTPLKETINQTIITKIKAAQHNGNPVILSRDDRGNVLVQQSVEGTLRDIYVKDNDKLTIDKLLELEVDPFIVKSNGNGSGNPNQEGNRNQSQQRQQNSDKEEREMTLEELRWKKHRETQPA